MGIARRAGRTAAAVALAVGASIGGLATPAAAAGPCQVGWVCLYNDESFQGGMWYHGDAAGTYNLSGFNDIASSWINNSWYRDAKWFWGANASGGSACMNTNSSKISVGWYNNDEASSVVVYTDDRAC
ncbi:hypothetical protein KNE206_02060 [Kitasatospora sp. NE20-6]|uniref:peptidase inhibitor family I36 protein n=1 Tax=Kitasatospora sp. NE20-6 TaxID=2859066 RepID=UPI0034DC6977